MRLISNDISQIGSSLQFDKNDRFRKTTTALNRTRVEPAPNSEYVPISELHLVTCDYVTTFALAEPACWNRNTSGVVDKTETHVHCELEGEVVVISALNGRKRTNLDQAGIHSSVHSSCVYRRGLVSIVNLSTHRHTVLDQYW